MKLTSLVFVTMVIMKLFMSINEMTMMTISNDYEDDGDADSDDDDDDGC